MLNKPVGVVSSLRDEQRPTGPRRFTRGYEERLFNVGRLDAQTSGLLILTNDGELAHVLAHPSFGVSKTYIAKVQGVVTPQTLRHTHPGHRRSTTDPIAADRAKAPRAPFGGQSTGRDRLSTPAATELFGGCWPRSVIRSSNLFGVSSARCISDPCV